MDHFCGGMFCLLVAMTFMTAGEMPLVIKNGGKWKSALAGCFAAAVVQSSSAVSCAVCAARRDEGLSDAAARALLIGANVGTTLTPFLTALGAGLSDRMMLLFPLVGMLSLILRSKLPKPFEILPVFCLLMWGLALMGTAAPELVSRLPQGAAERLFSSPVAAFCGGAALTALLQSSSVCIGLIQMASLSLPLSRAAVLPMLIGQNVGTASTALIATVGAGRQAKACARYHLCFNLRGAAWALPLCLCLRPLLSDPAGPFFMAAAHFAFNFVNALIHLLFFKEKAASESY